jgi:hypothetical protein
LKIDAAIAALMGEDAEQIAIPGTFEPLLAGDRQIETRVAKADIRCKQKDALRSVCRELHRVALAA